MKKSLLIIGLATSAYASTSTNYQTCHSAKEYITTFNFLKMNKALSLKENDIKKIADEVSTGCKESALRFIKVYKVLTKSGLEGSDAINLATKFSKKSNEHTSTFLTIFSESFLEKYLDLNIKDAVNISTKLSLNLDGDIKKIRKDFQTTVKFCISEKELNLTGTKCAQIASDVVRSGAKYNNEMSRSFLKSFKYNTAKNGVNLATYQAVNLSLELIKSGPSAYRNFKDAYEFAKEKSNLDLTKVKAIEFAKTMAKRSSKEVLESHTK